MVGRGCKKIRKNLFENRGYSLVEMVTVMGMLAIITLLSFGAYESTRKERYVRYAAEITQTEAHNSFVEVLSTKVENSGTCTNQAPQVKALKIKIDNSVFNTDPMISKVALCLNGSDSTKLKSPAVVGSIDVSQGINYKKNVGVTLTKPDGTTLAQGYLYLIFTSPYGEYYSYYSSNTNYNSADTELWGTSGSNWVKDARTQVFKPANPTAAAWLDGNVEVSFRSTDGTASHKLTISKNGSITID